MTIRTCSAALILGLWCSSLGAAPVAGPLGTLVSAYRESPSPARRNAIVSYIVRHPKEAALGNLALGIAAYEQKNWAVAIARLKPLEGKLAPIDDYAAYYLALSRVESNDFGVTAEDLAAARRNSPLRGKSWLVEARARKASAAADAVRLLREHYAEAEPTVRYHPDRSVVLTSIHDLDEGQWKAGSLTGAVASRSEERRVGKECRSRWS